MTTLTRCFYCHKEYDYRRPPKCECSQKVWLHPREIDEKIRLAQNEALERAARKCDEFYREYRDKCWNGHETAAAELAHAIRAMKE